MAKRLHSAGSALSCHVILSENTADLLCLTFCVIEQRSILKGCTAIPEVTNIVRVLVYLFQLRQGLINCGIQHRPPITPTTRRQDTLGLLNIWRLLHSVHDIANNAQMKLVKPLPLDIWTKQFFLIPVQEALMRPSSGLHAPICLIHSGSNGPC
jgi:hypothetical protein